MMSGSNTKQSVSGTQICQASSPNDYDAAKSLMLEYLEVALGDDYNVGGAGLKEELENFPGPYQPPSGLLLLAKFEDHYCGCLALRPISKTTGEVMRMYVQPAMRGKGIAEMLMRQLLVDAKNIGYQEVYLDSLKRFTSAHKLYEKLGFIYCPPYDPNTTAAMKENMVFMRLDLSA